MTDKELLTAAPAGILAVKYSESLSSRVTSHEPRTAELERVLPGVHDGSLKSVMAKVKTSNHY